MMASKSCNTMNGIQKEIFEQLSLRYAQFRIISHFQHTVHNCVAGCDTLQSAKNKTSALSELVDTQAHISGWLNSDNP